MNVTDWLIGISALATLAVAIAAFWAIKNSISQGKRNQEENLERETRERKERYINEIIDWINEINRAYLDLDDFITSEQMEGNARLPLSRVLHGLQTVREKGKSVKGIAAIFDINLLYCVIATQKNLEKLIRKIDMWIMIANLAGESASISEIEKLEILSRTLNRAINASLRYAVSNKLSLL